MPNPYQPQIDQAWAVALNSIAYYQSTLGPYNAACVAYLPLLAANDAAVAAYKAHRTQQLYQEAMTAYNAARNAYATVISTYNAALSAYGNANNQCINAMNLYNAHLEDTPPPAEPDPGPLPPAPNGIVLPPLPPSGPVGPG